MHLINFIIVVSPIIDFNGLFMLTCFGVVVVLCLDFLDSGFGLLADNLVNFCKKIFVLQHYFALCTQLPKPPFEFIKAWKSLFY